METILDSMVADLRTNEEQKKFIYDLFDIIAHLIQKCRRYESSLNEHRLWLREYKEKIREHEMKLAAMGLVPTRSLMQEEWDIYEQELLDWQDLIDTYLDPLRG